MSIKRKKNGFKKKIPQAKESLNKSGENLWIYFLLKYIFWTCLVQLLFTWVSKNKWIYFLLFYTKEPLILKNKFSAF